MQNVYGTQSPQEPALELLARELQVSIDEVTSIYSVELSKLEVDANVKRYLHIFAIRKVRETLNQVSPEKRPFGS